MPRSPIPRAARSIRAVRMRSTLPRRAARLMPPAPRRGVLAAGRGLRATGERVHERHAARASRASPAILRRLAAVARPRARAPRPRLTLLRATASTSRSAGRRDGRPRRRIGLRQVDGRAVRRPLRADARHHHADVAIAGEGPTRDATALRRPRRGMQMIFQDPYASLNPRWRVADIVAEPIAEPHASLPRRARESRRGIARLQVGLAPPTARQVPAPVLGRAAAAHLDRARASTAIRVPRVRRAHVRARRLGAGAGAEPDARPAAHASTYLFISHNLAVVHHIADRVGVMYLSPHRRARADARALREPGIPTRGCCSTPCPTSR